MFEPRSALKMRCWSPALARQSQLHKVSSSLLLFAAEAIFANQFRVRLALRSVVLEDFWIVGWDATNGV
jgi:hypothetical protein